MFETLSPALNDDIEQRACAVLTRACELNLRLATAESCTGGLLASLLTDVEGCAHAFDRGFVAYTNDAKVRMLAVSLDTLGSQGPVSLGVAVEMARGALAASDADIAVSVTGFAGPAGPDDEPGLVYFAAVRGDRLLKSQERFGPAGRGAVRLGCLRVMLELIAALMARDADPSIDQPMGQMEPGER